MSASIFNIQSPPTTPKVYFSHAQLSSKYLDPAQPPTKATPFRQINGVPFVEYLKVCMPTWVWRDLYGRVDGEVNDDQAEDNDIRPRDAIALSSGPRLEYAKVRMTMKDLLDDEDLRRGNYLLLSRPNSPSSSTTTIAINRGTLTIDMPHEVYQRSGLPSSSTKTIPGGGRKHNPKSARYRVQMDLRQPSMVKGKKGFDRLMYASKNVDGLKEERVWLFSDLSNPSSSASWRSLENAVRKKRKRDEVVEASVTEKAAPAPAAPVEETMSSELVTASHPSHDDHDTSDAKNKITVHPLSKHNPVTFSITGQIKTSSDILVPHFLNDPVFFSNLSSLSKSNTKDGGGGSNSYHNPTRGGLPTILEDDIYSVTEYLSLLFLESPRITKAGYDGPGRIDPYLCQYTLPDIPSVLDVWKDPIVPHDDDDDDDEQGSNIEKEIITENLHQTTYSGFIPSTFVTQLLVDIIRRSRSRPRSRTRPKEDLQLNGAVSGTTGGTTPISPRNNPRACPWVAIQFTAHKTDVRGGTDGCQIILQGNTSDHDSSQHSEDGSTGGTGPGHPDEMELAEEQDDEPTDLSAGKKTSVGKGFTHATCFEFVDS